VTIFGTLLPPVNVRTTPEKPKKKKAQLRGPMAYVDRVRHRKYDHDAMLRDRIAGLSWEEIAKKYGVVDKSPKALATLCFNSSAMKKLKPHEVLKVGGSKL
jgi:hypothetical protein